MEQALYQAAVLTFEELGFMFPVERQPAEQLSQEASVCIGVKFSGKISGQVVLQIENAILPTIAANMLGADDLEFEREIQLDALGELTNVICGNTLPAIAGKQEIFRLSPPRTLMQTEINECPVAVAYLDVEENKADVMLYID